MAAPNERLNYADGNRLTLRDLITEQNFHLEQIRRHRLAAHDWGILTGLDVVLREDGGLMVTPGYAVDGYGRPLLLEVPIAIPADAFLDRDTNRLDLHLVYAQRVERGGAPPRCGVPEGDRIVERPFLRLSLPELSRRPRWLPPGVPSADLDYTAADPGVPADEPWPIYLGRARYTPDENPPFTADPSGRRYSGIVAAQIRAASDGANLRLGRTDTGIARLAYRVAVGGGETELLAIREDGTADLDATLTATGNLTLDGGGFSFSAAPGANPPVLPASLSLGEGTNLAGEATTDLRIALPEAPEGRGRFVVGAWSEMANAFQPILTVTNDGTVSINGNLTQLPSDGDPGQPKSQPGFDEAAQQVIQAAMFNAISGTGSALINSILNGGAVGPFAPENLGLSGAMLAGVVAQILPLALVDDFAEQLHAANQPLAEALQEALDDAGGGEVG